MCITEPAGRPCRIFRAGAPVSGPGISIHPAHGGLARRGAGTHQDVLIKAFQALPGWRPEAEFRTWLFRIASNTATDALRRRKVVEFVALDEDYDVRATAPVPKRSLRRSSSCERSMRAHRCRPTIERFAVTRGGRHVL